MPDRLGLVWRDGGRYPVFFQEGLLARALAAGTGHAPGGAGGDAGGDAASGLAAILSGRRVLVVTTPTPWRSHVGPLLTSLAARQGATLEVLERVLDEPAKTMDAVLGVCDRAESHGLGRRDLILAVGGGVCCDVVSVAGSLYRRGVAYACLPTTLVAQVDAGVGLKGAVNVAGAKNRLGCFHPPQAVFSDPRWLGTLPDEALRAGLAEIVKVAVMRDPGLFTLVERHGRQLIGTGFQAPAEVGRRILSRATAVMLDELSLDPFERRGYRRRMDFGHSYSPILEEASGYALPHGQAVSVDMALSCEIAVALGLVDRAVADRIVELLLALGLPLTTPWCEPALVLAAFAAASAHRGGELHLPLPTDIGSAVFLSGGQPASGRLVADAVDALRARSESRGQHEPEPLMATGARRRSQPSAGSPDR